MYFLRQWPLLIPVTAIVIGIFVSDDATFSGNFFSTYGFTPLFISLLFLAVSTFLKRTVFFFFWLAIFFFFWGFCGLQVSIQNSNNPDTISKYASNKGVEIEGVITSRPSTSPEGLSFSLQTEFLFREKFQYPVSGVVMVHVAGGDISVARGDRIRTYGRLSVPRLKGLPGEFDYRRYLRFHQIDATFRTTDAGRIVLMRGRAETSLLREIDDVAEELKTFIEGSVTDKKISSVLTALLIGDQKQIPKEIAIAYKNAGVNHILSISGFHIGIIAAVLVFFFRYLLTLSPRLALHYRLHRVSLLISLPIMIWYLLLTGAAPATSRAVIMLTLFVAALYAERETDQINTLLLAGFFLLSINPPTLFDISFQLSFLALWGIILTAEPAVRLVDQHIKNRFASKFTLLLLTSISASLATSIPLLYTFSQTSFNGIIANLIIVPILGFGATTIGFVALSISYVFPPIGTILLKIAGIMTLCSNALAEYFASFPVVHFYSVSKVDVFLFLAVLMALTFIKPKTLKIVISVCLPLIAVIIHLQSPTNDGKLHIKMLSVGQGESILIKLPSGKTLLVDGGGYLHDTDKDFGEDVLAPALHRIGVKKIDNLFLTHSHPDHIGGLAATVSQFSVENVWESEFGGVGKLYEQFQGVVSRKKIVRHTVSAGMTILLDEGISLQVLSPQNMGKSVSGDLDDENNASLVLRLSYKDFSILLTGDAGFRAENIMLSSGQKLSSTVLKVGHHGSRYSTSEQFLHKVNPKIAIISSGYENNFGLPSSDTIEQLNNNGILIYRTDLDGTIEIITDGKKTDVETPYKNELYTETLSLTDYALVR